MDRITPGTRAAVALAGVDVADAPRGTVLVTHSGWRPSSLLLAEVALLDDAPASLGPRTRVRFHLGTTDVGARVVVAGGALARGERRQARIVLDEPVVARAGDRFVLRSASPLHTIGGGVVEDPLPGHRRARPAPTSAATPAERFARVLATAGGAGLPRDSLPVRIGLAPDEAASLVAARSGDVRAIGDRLFPAALAATLGERLLEAVRLSHRRSPLEPGAPLQLLRAQLGADPALVDEVVRDLAQAGSLEVRGAFVALPGWEPVPTAEQQAVHDAIKRRLEEAGQEPPSVEELTARHGSDATALLRYLERRGDAIQVEPGRYYATAVVKQLVEKLRTKMAADREYSPAELRDLLGFSRKYLIPFLEYCDRVGVTERRVSGRVIGA